MKKLEGGCQCGHVRYSVNVANYDAYYCHCRMCQKAFGNIFASLILVKKSEVTWLKEQPSFFQSSKLAQRGFCSKCGTPLTFEYLDGQSMDLSVGSLDQPGLMKPTCHNGVESRVESFAWHDTLPQTRTEDNKKYVSKWQAAYGPGSMPGPVLRI